MKTCHLVWGAVLALAVSSSAQAALDTTPDEIAMLPAYCDAKMGKRAPEAVTHWRNQMGQDNWLHLHHYCGGLIELNRYYRSSTGRKTASLRNAVNEFNGMLQAWTPDFYLRPEAHLNRGKALKFMGKSNAAQSDFLKALELNPKLASASIELADLYVKQGKKLQALTVLKKGLEQAPATKSLRRRYQELGGDVTAFPETASPPVEPLMPAQAEASKPTPGEPSQPAESTPTELVKAPPAAVSPPAPKIGNKTNPWCRFCPDPAVSEPAVSEPAVSEPAVSEPAVSEPAVTKPAVSESAVPKSAVPKSAVPKSAVSKPAVSKPAVSKPAVSKPAVSKSAVSKSAVSKPDKPQAD